MAKTKPPQESFADALFPLMGIDRSRAYYEQPQGGVFPVINPSRDTLGYAQRAGTTFTATNCRAFESQTQRGRGGSRYGISRYLNSQVIPGADIQHLNFIVDPQADALGISFTDAPGEDFDIEDPTIPTFFLDDGSINDITPGGTGDYTNKKYKRKYPKLTIIANNRSKMQGTTLVFAGTEFTTKKLLPSDAVVSATITSTGAASGAANGTYPIKISNAVITLGNSPLHNPYRVKYVSGVLTVSSSVIIPVLIQGSASGSGAGTIFGQAAVSNPGYINSNGGVNVTAGNLLVAMFFTSFSAVFDWQITSVTDTLGNVWTRAVVLDVASFPPSNQPVELSIWYCIAGTSGNCGLQPLLDPTNLSLSATFVFFEVANANAAVDGTATNSGTGSTGSPGTVNVTQSSDAVIAAYQGPGGNQMTFQVASAPVAPSLIFGSSGAWMAVGASFLKA